MEVELLFRPGYSAAHLTLAPNEHISAEAGAMIAMSGDLGIETTTHQKSGGGVLSGLKRMLTGESFFLNHFTAGANGGDLYLATTLPGDMNEQVLDGSSKLIVQAGSFVACEQSVTMGMGWQGFTKALFSGESWFWLELSGTGKLLLSSFGAIYPMEVNGEFVVDTGHIVAFDETLDFRIAKASRSLIGSFLGGEGFVCRFKGQGTVWCQSHNARNFGRTLGPKLRSR